MRFICAKQCKPYIVVPPNKQIVDKTTATYDQQARNLPLVWFFERKTLHPRCTTYQTLIVGCLTSYRYYIGERGSSAVERRTQNRESPSSNTPFATVSKLGHLSSLHNASVHSAV